MMARFCTTVLVLTLLASLLGACGGGESGSLPPAAPREPGPSGSSTSPSASSPARITANDWVWLGGSALDTGMYYAAPGSGATFSQPGGREGGAAWVDASGNFWLFGGYGFVSPATSGSLSDLWEYQTATQSWTWVSGSSSTNNAGSYGTQFAGSSTNNPGARSAAATWLDGKGRLWLFGGLGYDGAGVLGTLNDLWVYDPAHDTWAWISGSAAVNATGSYTTGVGAEPGPRYAATSWTDRSGNFWLFGGESVPPGVTLNAANVDWNDLWMFDPVAETWTWVSGSNSPAGNASYGTRGGEAPTNVPGARKYANSWTDAQGNLWLFGGCVAAGGYPLGCQLDVWRFDVATRQWAWMAGPKTTTFTPTVPGTQGSESALGTPGSRLGSAVWVDPQGMFWLFGGIQEQLTSSNTSNDLWRFNPQTLEWAWVAGSTSPGAPADYGSVGVGAPSNIPGSLVYGATALSNGHVWMFGGALEAQVFPDSLWMN